MTLRQYKLTINRQYKWYYRLARRSVSVDCNIRYSNRLDAAIEGITDVATTDFELELDDFEKLLEYARFVRNRFDEKYSI